LGHEGYHLSNQLNDLIGSPNSGYQSPLTAIFVIDGRPEAHISPTRTTLSEM
jgi:hypothetical protein